MPKLAFRWRVVDYYMTRVKASMRILEQLDMVGKTSELSRLFGIQFLEVLTRGSQFRVESIMLRLVRAKNFIPVSPSIKVSRAATNTLNFLQTFVQGHSFPRNSIERFIGISWTPLFTISVH